ncbi:MAG: hypothetical protein HY082_01430 [Gammaproteobacteria bacterium]|nr:hypothetical protein [Gammaproteobacteria bacterium]MBI5782796.1 hypothetical protein [Gammaproteobacteria bacterium]
MLKKILQYSGQVVFYGLFVAVIGYFSSAPAYVHFPPDMALIKASFSHAGQPKEECHVRTADELAKLPPNMRVAIQCGRERSPVVFELELDGKPVYRAELPPAGLSRDGVSTVYQRFPVPAGRHRLRARLKDSARAPDFNYVKEADVELAPAQVFVVEFNARTGGFVFK